MIKVRACAAMMHVRNNAVPIPVYTSPQRPAAR
jgi:hypothetical protein